MSATPESAIQQFVLLGKNLKGRTAASLVSQAVSHPQTYVFGELLDLEGIKGLKGSEFQQAYNLLELFAYGTYQEYKGTMPNSLLSPFSY